MFLLAVLVIILFGACQPRMEYQPKLKTYSVTSFYADGSAARPLPADTVPYHQSSTSDFLISLPKTSSLELIRRGQDRYEIFCSVCHGLDGRGKGMAALRGFPEAPSFLSRNLEVTSLNHLIKVESDGIGEMKGFKDRITLSDQLAIAVYIRALQLSQTEEESP